jgi:tetratricopeptide (TPR) repeat protein
MAVMKKPVPRGVKESAPPSTGRAAGRTPAEAPASEAASRGPHAPPMVDASSQSAMFEQAARLFHRGDFGAAMTLYERAAAGPQREMAHSAALHARMCAKRLARPEMSLRTADEHYDYAVALINERKLEQAERHLLLAIAQTPKADHLFYALALCRGLAGDLAGAHSNLKRAIELQPRNRAAARNDPDFVEIAQLSPIVELLYPERASS